MPTNITPAVSPSFPALLTVPTDGDPNAALSVITPFQSALDGIAVARAGLWGAGRRRSYRCLDGVNVTIDALGVVVVTAGGAWVALPHTAATTVTAAALTGGLANHTRYYIYAQRTAGVIAFTATTTAPEGSLSYENGNTDRAYVGTFVTDGTPVVRRFLCRGGMYHYDTTGAVFLPGINAGSALAFTTVSLDQPTIRGVPPHAATAYLAVIVNMPAGSDGGDSGVSVDFSLPGAGITHTTITGPGSYLFNAITPRAGRIQTYVWIPITGQSTDYRVSSNLNTATIEATFFVRGFLDA